MTRYRKPATPGSKYSTPEGERRLRAELDELWRVLRPQVTKAVQEAAAQGDRSENAEYIYGKRQLREIDRRVRFLRKRLEGMIVVTRPPDDRSRIFFGAWVQVEDDDGAATEFRIVGPDETRPGAALRQHGFAAGARADGQARRRRSHDRDSRWHDALTSSSASVTRNRSPRDAAGRRGSRRSTARGPPSARAPAAAVAPRAAASTLPRVMCSSPGQRVDSKKSGVPQRPQKLRVASGDER